MQAGLPAVRGISRQLGHAPAADRSADRLHQALAQCPIHSGGRGTLTAISHSNCISRQLSQVVLVC